MSTADHTDSVVQLCSDLIRIDSSPAGDGERAAAEFVAAELAGLGLEPQLYEPLPRRTSVVARIAGTDPARPALLVQLHLDVVAADAPAWSVPPFSGEVRDGHVWGRGAVDMKDMVAMTLTALRVKLASGWRPARDIVIALLADEEKGGLEGAGWLVDTHPDLFEGCTESIGEAGGFSHEIAEGRRAYFVQIAEKGITWLRLTAHGPGGHGSLIHPGNPIVQLAEALLRVQGYVPPHYPIESTESVVAAAQEWSGEQDPVAALESLGPLGRLFLPTLRSTYSITRLDAGRAAQRGPVPGRGQHRRPVRARARARAAGRDPRPGRRPGRRRRRAAGTRGADQFRRAGTGRDQGRDREGGPRRHGRARVPADRHRRQAFRPAGHSQLRFHPPALARGL